MAEGQEALGAVMPKGAYVICISSGLVGLAINAPDSRDECSPHSCFAITNIRLEVGTKKMGVPICATVGPQNRSACICSINCGDSIQNPSLSTDFTTPIWTRSEPTIRKATCLLFKRPLSIIAPRIIPRTCRNILRGAEVRTECSLLLSMRADRKVSISVIVADGGTRGRSTIATLITV